MALPTRTALVVLLGGASLGIVGDAFLRRLPWGLNFPLWVLLLAGLAWVTLRAVRHHPPERPAALALGLAVLFAAGFAVRDSWFLRAWDVLAVLAALSIAVLATQGTRLATGRIRDYAGGAALAGMGLAVGAVPLLATDTPWAEITGNGRRRRMGSLLVGSILAIPVALVFGGLFASADPVFETVVESLFHWTADTMVSHLFVVGVCTWVAAGYLRGLIVRARMPSSDSSASRAFGMLELGIPLGLLLFLLVVFVAIQVGYLFGGNEFVQQATGPSYATYARRGFFELVAASTLVLPILLGAWWALDAERPGAMQSFRALAVAILVLVGMVMISALTRMRLYVIAYGLTEDRLYATAFMLWIGFVLGWFGWTVLRARPAPFAFGSVVSGFLVLAGLNIVNPDALIVRTNMERAAAGMAFDVAYIDGLSADAAPALLSRWPALTESDRCRLRQGFLAREVRADGDWRSWNIARWRARREMERSGVTPGEAVACATASPPPTD